MEFVRRWRLGAHKVPDEVVPPPAHGIGTVQTVAMRPVDVLRIFKPADAIEQSVIGKGLEPGEMVISEGQMRLFPGGKVRVLAPEGPAGKPGGSAAPGAL